jgi:hypothetical protein
VRGRPFICIALSAPIVLIAIPAAIAPAGEPVPARENAASTASAAAYPWNSRVRAAARFARDRAGTISFAVVDDRGRIHGFRRRRRFNSASVVKVMLMVAYLRQGGVRHRRLRSSDRRLLGPMIRRSDDATASTIYAQVGDGGLRRVARRARMRRFRPGGSVWGLSQITARDQAWFMRRVDRLIPARHRSFAMHLLTQIIPRQRWGIPPASPKGWQVHFKGGFVPGWTVHQVALLRRGSRRLSLAVLTRHSPSLAYGAETIRGVTARLLRSYNRFASPPRIGSRPGAR